MNRFFEIENMSVSSHSDSSEYETAEESDYEMIFDEDVRIIDICRTYIDTNEFTIENLKDAVLMYDLVERTDRRNKLADYLRTNLCVEDIIEVYEEAIELKLSDLIKICREYITKKTSEILKHHSFVTAKYNTVLEIISNKILAVHSELEVYNAVVKWGKRNFKENNPRILRQKIFPLLQKVRFVSMSYSEFSGSPCIDGLITKDEQLEIFKVKSNYIVETDDTSLMEGKWSNERWFEFLSSCYFSADCKNYLYREKSCDNILNIKEYFRSKLQYLKVWGVSIQVNVKLANNNNGRLNPDVSLDLRIHNLATDEVQSKYLEISLRENKNFSGTEKINLILHQPVIIRNKDLFRIDVRSLLIDEDVAEFIYCANDCITYNDFIRIDYDGDEDYDVKPHLVSIIATY